MPQSRRDFLHTAAAGALAALLPGLARAEKPAGLPLVKLAAQLKVPLLGIGTGVKAGNRTNVLWRQGEAHFADTIRRAYDEGVRLFDCADSYGSLPHVARALKDKPRDSFVLVTKIWCHPKGGIPEDEPRDNAAAVIERSLREAQTDYLDLVQMHCQTAADWTTKFRAQMDQIDAFKQKGLVRAHGCSCHSLAALEAAAADPWVDVVHTRINPWGIKMDGPADQVVPVLKKIHAAGKGVIGMKLVGEGAYKGDSDKINEALRFVLGLGCVDALIVGFESPAEVTDYRGRLAAALTARAAATPA
jgi:aryl-alcohol dehydrogenase-like predicted oxidoreductase